MEEKLRVLVVEDEFDLRQLICKKLVIEGHTVDQASGGEEAWKLINEIEYDLVITDIRMADGDGIELLQKIRNQNAELPAVIMITGYSDLTAEDAYDLGAESILSKPFRMKLFSRTLDEVIKARALRWEELKDAKQEADLAPARFETEVSSFEKLAERAEEESCDFALGRGGFFVYDKKPKPSVGEAAFFRIKSRDKSEEEIEGVGIVRWIRPGASNKLKPGYGIEIQKLSAGSLATVCQLLAEKTPRAFIPKCCAGGILGEKL